MDLTDEGADQGAVVVYHPPQERAALQQNLTRICNILFNTDIKSIEYAGAVLLTSVLQDNPLYYTRYIQNRGDNFLEIMNSEEQSSKESAYAAGGPLEENIDNDIVISGRSPRASAVHVGNFGQAAVQEALLYTNLIQFVSTIRANIDNICVLMLELVQQIQIQIIQVVPVQAAQTARIYDNILLVKNKLLGDVQQIFPKFSLNIICQKEPLLQTILLAGRENGMGKVLNNFVFRRLQQYFGDTAKLKIVEPSESSRLWQVKISIHENDFIFFTVQIINVHDAFFDTFPAPPDNAVRLQTTQSYENLCFSLYNKANSRDFNCFCGLSDVDNFAVIQIGREHLNNLFVAIQIFLTNLIDVHVNIKKKYFILGLYNLIYCYFQTQYTIETKVYRWLFDRPVPELTVVAGQDNKNVFLYAMRIIQHVNNLCNRLPDQEEKPRVVMGGGKQYSLFQKALNKFSIQHADMFRVCMQRVIDELYPDDVSHQHTQRRETLAIELQHTIIKAAADSDFGFYHKRGALGSVECMSVCMLLQVALKKLIDYLVQPGYETYEVDIGNSCIGNPPSTLSSLRIALKNSHLFYNNTVPDEIQTLINQMITALGIDLNNISSMISPFDIVPKGSMEDYVQHIIEAVLLFGGIQTPDLAILSQILSNYCMITAEGFSSALKGIFDIFYTLFIIENFTNRTLVTQKINKELKRISICAQILYLHYSELHDVFLNLDPALVDPNDAAAAAAHIVPMLNILRDMISYGYNGNLLNPQQFTLIMRKYVEFMNKLIEFNLPPPIGGLGLNFYCVDPRNTLHIGRGLTPTELFFMNLLENSNHEPQQPADVAPPPPPAIPPQIMPNPQNAVERDNLPENIFFSLGCIPNVIAAIRAMDQPIIMRLCQNKTYASFRDTQNKSNSIVVISMAYQSFLWSIDEPTRRLIRGRIRDIEIGQDNIMFNGNDTPAIGLLEIFRGNINFFNDLLTSILPCVTQNLLDISIEPFDGIRIDNPLNFQFFCWFITCIFGIKTKSAPKKIISITRTYLIKIKEVGLNGLLFGCNIFFPDNPNPALAPVEVEAREFAHVQPGQIPDLNSPDILCLAYDPYTIDKALNLYTSSEANFRHNPQNYVFKIGNMIVIRKNSEVLRRNVLSRLTEAFTKLPRGQAYLNQSHNFMLDVLSRLHQILFSQAAAAAATATIGAIINTISNIPILLTENPYKPTPHDVSKFVDFDQHPQFFRNRWLVHLITEIFNSGDDGEKLFNNMKLLILLFKYLTLLPIDIVPENAISTNTIDIQTVTTQRAIDRARDLIIQIYTCGRIAQRNLSPQVEQQIEEARITTQGVNSIVNIAAADACLVDAVCGNAVRTAQIAPADIPPAAAAAGLAHAVATHQTNVAAAAAGVVTRNQARAVRRNAATAAAAAAAVHPQIIGTPRKATPHENTKKGLYHDLRRDLQGGTIRIRNPHSPKKPNNHTRKNKYKRNNKNKNKKHKYSPKYRKINPSSRSGSQSNKKKSKSKLPQKNVTFKRRKYNK